MPHRFIVRLDAPVELFVGFDALVGICLYQQAVQRFELRLELFDPLGRIHHTRLEQVGRQQVRVCELRSTVQNMPSPAMRLS